jgi:hypothetical protein
MHTPTSSPTDYPPTPIRFVLFKLSDQSIDPPSKRKIGVDETTTVIKNIDLVFGSILP